MVGVLALNVVMVVSLVGVVVAITVTTPSAGVAIIIFLTAFAFFGWRMNHRHAPQRLAANDPAAVRCQRALEPLSMLGGVTDLRTAGISDLFHFLPALREEPEGMRRMWATHPPLAVRLAQLERLERELQHPSAD
jgi:Zn-dependent protease with chaperone function